MLRASKRNQPCPHLDFRTVREYIFVVLNHSVCDTLFWQLWEANAANDKGNVVRYVEVTNEEIRLYFQKFLALEKVRMT